MAAIDPHPNDKLFVERLLDLRSVLDDLVRAKRVSQREAEDLLIAPRTQRQLHMHPLEYIAEQEFDDLTRPGKKLDLEVLTHWLCELAGQPYYRIDPLKVNVNRTTEVMSYAFAQRHNILAVEVKEDEVVIASAQPFMSSWEGMLAQTLRGRRIQRVVTNPEDLSRYMLEFYTMARSRRRPMPASKSPASPTSSSCSNSVSSSRRMPTMRTSSTSSTGCCSTRSISAPATFTSSRVATKATCVSASTVSCTTSTNCRRRSTPR
jgi:hypothetical protein